MRRPGLLPAAVGSGLVDDCAETARGQRRAGDLISARLFDLDAKPVRDPIDEREIRDDGARIVDRAVVEAGGAKALHVARHDRARRERQPVGTRRALDRLRSRACRRTARPSASRGGVADPRAAPRLP